MKKIKNFCIIAHIDHGKSTLSDRLIEFTASVPAREMKPQLLDSMDLERERGITIKLNAVRLFHKDYQLNLIDTPGHADFSYEVSRSLSACEGAILLIDSTQGVQAQTVSNYSLAIKENLNIIVALNKIDMPNSMVDLVSKQIEDNFKINSSEIVHISAKTGFGVDELLGRVIDDFEDAQIDDDAPLKAIVFDSYYDSFKGVIIFVRLYGGRIKKGEKIKFMKTNTTSTVIDLGIKTPNMKSMDELTSGEVGWLNVNVKNIREIKVGDTVTLSENPCSESLPGYSEVLPMVFSLFFPTESEKQDVFKSAIEKLSLSDGSFVYQYESSASLGFGCRCGFLGLLHMEIIKERLFREYGISIISTYPTVKYQLILKNGENMFLTSPADMPDVTKIQMIKEPYVIVSLMMPVEYIGGVMDLMEKFRSKYFDLNYLSSERAVVRYEIPLGEIIYDFYDSIKTVTKGYGIVDYELSEYKEGDLVKVDILLNGSAATPFSFITDRSQAYYKSKRLVEKLKEFISPHLFEIAIQASINQKVIARENIKALRKNVTAKCYGGDITRKKKLWEQQKKGKKKMKQIGKVSLPPDIFEKVFSR